MEEIVFNLTAQGVRETQKKSAPRSLSAELSEIEYRIKSASNRRKYEECDGIACTVGLTHIESVTKILTEKGFLVEVVEDDLFDECLHISW